MITREHSSEAPLYRILPEWLSGTERSILGVLSMKGVWEEGRQGTGYEKYNILNANGTRWAIQRALESIGNPDEFDAWILRYPTGSEIPEHTDPAEDDKCHVRLNAILVAGTGGQLTLGDEELPLKSGDAYIFRPDITPHNVRPVTVGPRLVLSVGANVEPDHAQALGLA